ncbi:uncharacterized protein LOC113351122 [Papaver somniferum]|uniref:uncharacterized protein LOC113351122 n=1 Tax=Papaver somniferum TaxID=3469 RepID=UPI000E6FD5E6|nr:uncharacterized protein LOC113351122 [Papaver somniferum]
MTTQRFQFWKKLEADFWHKKSGVNWFKESDNNTAFFHSFANRRRSRNHISSLRDDRGQWYHTQKDLEILLTKHFSGITQSTNPKFEDTSFDIITQSVSEDDNTFLISIPSEDEIFSVLKNMPRWNSSGPDGFRHDSFYPNGILLVVTWSTRMKPLMEKIISPTQATYVPRRYINDNIVTAHELVHTMKKSKKKNGLVALKLDMSKAFDGIEWAFIDRMLFSLGFCEDWRNMVKSCLENFCTISGQMINFSKLSAFKVDIMNALGVKQLSSSNKYLGLPILLGKSKVNSFVSIQEADEHRFQGWVSKTLNQADRSTLVKNLEIFNKALLIKLAWRLCTEYKTICTQLMKVKYSPYTSFLHLQDSPSTPSWIWNGIDLGLSYVRKFSRWEVRDGKSISVWEDKWIIGLDSPPKPNDSFREPAAIVFVSDLLLDKPRRWNIQLVLDLFDFHTSQLILKMYIGQEGKDRLIWEPNRSGSFSVKSTYKALSKLENVHSQLCSATFNVN